MENLTNDEILNSENKIKKPRGKRPKKEVKYQNEQLAILQNLNNILGVTKENNFFYVCDIDEEKKTSILNLKDSVKNFFVAHDNSIVRRELHDNSYLTLMKLVYKQFDIKWIRALETVKRNDISIRTGKYIITFNE
jgi:hypothetical protein